MAKKKPLKCTVCEGEGGAFVILGSGPVHKKCRGGVAMRDLATNPFAFETAHISGDPNAAPIQVRNLHHLRKLEKEFGVVSVLANYDRQDIPISGGKEQFHDRGER